MSLDAPHNVGYARGKAALSKPVNPGMGDALRARYDALVPGLSETVVDAAYGKYYARGTLAVDEKTRLLATIAAIAALGGQTRPQLKVNVSSARAVDASREEIAEIIFQMTLHGGCPAMINALNAAMDVFEEEDKREANNG